MGGLMQIAEPVRSILKQKGNAVYSLPPEASVLEAVALMSEKGAGAIAVMRDGRLEGMISERDYARKVVLCGRSSDRTSIGEIMSSPVITVAPEEPVGECLRLMSGRRIRHLPVVEAGRVLGVVSIGDLVKWIVAMQEEKIQHLESFIAGAYPG